jgi:hypothetical protein
MLDLNPVEGLDEAGASHLRSGLFILLVAIFVLIAANFYMSGVGTAEGQVTTVVAVEINTNGKPEMLFAPQVTFRLPNGEVMSFIDKAATASLPQYVVRGKVSVVYEPEDPKTARIGDRNWVWINLAILLATAAVWFFRGILNMAFEVD